MDDSPLPPPTPPAPHLPALAAVPIPAVPGSLGSTIATTSDAAEQEAFMQKAESVFKLKALSQTALQVKPPPTVLPPKARKPYTRRVSLGQTNRGVQAVSSLASSSSASSVSSSSSSLSGRTPSPQQLQQHGDASAATTAEAGELDDFSTGFGDQVWEDDVVASAMQDFCPPATKAPPNVAGCTSQGVGAEEGPANVADNLLVEDAVAGAMCALSADEGIELVAGELDKLAAAEGLVP